MIISKLDEFQASGDVIDLCAGGDAIGNELYFNVIGSGPFTLTTGDTEGASDVTLLSGTSDGRYSARVPLGLERYVKATFTGEAFFTHAPQYAYADL